MNTARKLLTLLPLLLTPRAARTQSPIILGYVLGHDHLIQPGEIDARKLTRIHYAFLYPEAGKVSAAWPTDDANLRTLVALKRISPNLEVLASIGGGAHSAAFSDLALTARSRQLFVASCMALIEQYSLDGIDIDWEYPGSPTPSHPSRPEDRENYTLLLHDLREAFDRDKLAPHKHLILSTATNGKPFFLHATDMRAASRYLDTIALMGYDDYGPNSATTGNHAPLFTDSADPTAYSDSRYIHDYLAAGVPAAKIVLGVPFYGYGWHNVPTANHGLFQPVSKGSSFDVTFHELTTHELASDSGYIRYWDQASAAPYLYNASTSTFITYEDEKSLASKAAFVHHNGLAGIMFWEYSGDLNNILLNEIDNDLGFNPTSTK